MSLEAIMVVRTLFLSAWTIGNSFHIPGTDVTPIGFMMALFFIWFVVRKVGVLADIGVMVDSARDANSTAIARRDDY